MINNEKKLAGKLIFAFPPILAAEEDAGGEPNARAHEYLDAELPVASQHQQQRQSGPHRGEAVDTRACPAELRRAPTPGPLSQCRQDLQPRGGGQDPRYYSHCQVIVFFSEMH